MVILSKNRTIAISVETLNLRTRKENELMQVYQDGVYLGSYTGRRIDGVMEELSQKFAVGSVMYIMPVFD